MHDFRNITDTAWYTTKTSGLGLTIAKGSADRKTARKNSVRSNKRVFVIV